MGYPITAKQLIGLLRKGNIAILGALASMNMDHHSFAVDVGDLQGECFRDPQSASIDGGKASVVLKGADTTQNAEDFSLLHDTGKSPLLLGFKIGEDVPVAFQHVDEEEFDPAVGNAQSGRRPLVHISAMKEVVFELGLADLIRGSAVEVHEQTHRAGVAFLGALAHAGKLQGSDGLLEIIFHGNSPFVVKC